jgi:hypothetical protein
MKHESVPQMWKEWHARKGIPRKPLRNFKELCEELGVEVRFMRGKMNRSDAPKPVLDKVNRGMQKPYYDPDTFRAWWKKVKEEETK